MSLSSLKHDTAKKPRACRCRNRVACLLGFVRQCDNSGSETVLRCTATTDHWSYGGNGLLPGQPIHAITYDVLEVEFCYLLCTHVRARAYNDGFWWWRRCAWLWPHRVALLSAWACKSSWGQHSSDTGENEIRGGRRGEEEEQFFSCAEVQINEADFTCPPWFSPAACRFILQILDPNPKTVSVHAVQVVFYVMHHMNAEFKVCVLSSLPSSRMCSMVCVVAVKTAVQIYKT